MTQQLLPKNTDQPYIDFYISAKYEKFLPYVTITDTLVKANTFNSFFAKQCSLIEIGSEFPAKYLLSHHRLESVNLDPAKILFIIRPFDVSKAHEWDDVPVRMVKIYDESLVKPLFNIF